MRGWPYVGGRTLPSSTKRPFSSRFAAMACTRSSSAGRSDPRKGRRRPANMASRFDRTIRLRPAAPIPGHEPHQLLPAIQAVARCRPSVQVGDPRPQRIPGAAPRSPLAVLRLHPHASSSRHCISTDNHHESQSQCGRSALQSACCRVSSSAFAPPAMRTRTTGRSRFFMLSAAR